MTDSEITNDQLKRPDTIALRAASGAYVTTNATRTHPHRSTLYPPRMADGMETTAMTEQKPRVRVCLFKGPILEFGPRQVTRFKTRKAAHLLAFLAWHAPDAARRDDLIDLLWRAPDPYRDPNFGRSSLRAALTAIRHHLNELERGLDALLIANRTEVRLAPDAFTTDVCDFDRLIDAARRQPDPIRRVASLQQAVALYRGDLLPDCYEEWAIQQRRRLQDCYLTSVEQLVRSLLRTGDPREAMATLRCAVALHPDEEDLTALLEDLDPLTPARMGAAPQRLSTGRGSPRPLISLPVRLTRFFGRAEEIARLVEWCADPHTRLITVTGLGGIGKTRLAIEVARRMAGYPVHRIAFIELAPLQSPDRIPDAIAMALKLPPSPGVAPLDQLIAALSDRPTLLVLDNLEHLLHLESQSRKTEPPRPMDAADIVKSLLQQLPKLTCLCTSRSPLKLEGEQIFSLDPLPVPIAATPDEDQKDPKAPASFDSVRLFLDRARSARPDLRLTPTNQKAIAEICRRLDGIPLAIELTASWALTLSPGDMLDWLDRSTREFTTQHRDVPNRHYNMEEVLNWSYNLLTEPQQRVLARLSVFAGGWTLEAAEAICAGLNLKQRIAVLSNASLIRIEKQDNGAPRYRFLETVRQYALDRLCEVGEEATVRHRHASYFLPLAEEGGDNLSAEPPVDWLDRVEADLGNFRAALEWALKTKDEDGRMKDEGKASDSVLSLPSSISVRLTSALWPFWEARGHWREGQGYLERISEASVDTPVVMLARVHYGAARLALQLGEFGGAHTHIERSATLFREAQELHGVAHALRCSVYTLNYQHLHAEARAQYDESLKLFLKLGDHQGVAHAMVSMGHSAWHWLPLAEVQTLFAQGLTRFEKAGNRRGAADALGFLGHIRHFRGDYREARTLFTRCLAHYRELECPWGVAEALLHLGYVASNGSDYSQATTELEQSLAIYRDLGHTRNVVRLLCFLCEIACCQGRLDEAMKRVKEAMTLRDRVEDKCVFAMPALWLGILMLHQGKYRCARPLVGVSIALFREAEEGLLIAPALVEQGQVACGLKNYKAAKRNLNEALRTFTRYEHRRGKALAVSGLGLTALCEGDFDLARSYYRSSIKLLRRLKDRKSFAECLEGLAWAECSQGAPERAACLLGAVDGMRNAYGALLPSACRANYANVKAAVRSALDEAAFVFAWEKGRVMDWKQAVDYALGEIPPVSL